MADKPRGDFWVSLIHVFGVLNGVIAIVTLLFSFMILNGRYPGKEVETEYLAAIHWGWNQLGISALILGISCVCRLIETRWPPME